MGRIIGKGRTASETYPEPGGRGGSSIGGGNAILIDPSLPSAGNRFRTWAEAYAIVQASNAPIDIACAVQTIPVPAGVYDMKGGSLFSVQFGFGAGTLVTLADGAVLKNLLSIEGLELRGNSNTQTSLVWDQVATEASMKITFGATLANRGSHAMVEIAPNGFGDFAVINQSRVSAEPDPVFAIGDSGQLFVDVTLGGTGNFSNNFVSGPGTATLAYFHDGSMQSPLPTNGGFSGTVTNTPIQGVGGTTADRPTGDLNIGTAFFDTTIVPARPVFWNGTAWVDATGTPA